MVQPNNLSILWFSYSYMFIKPCFAIIIHHKRPEILFFFIPFIFMYINIII